MAAKNERGALAEVYITILHTAGVTGSIPVPPTTTLDNKRFARGFGTKREAPKKAHVDSHVDIGACG